MKRVYWFVGLLLIFSLLLAACGGSDEETAVEATALPTAAPVAIEEAAEEAAPPAAEATAVPMSDPTAVPEPTAEPIAAEVSAADLNFDDPLAELDSYRYNMVLFSTGKNEDGAVVTTTMNVQVAITTNPTATAMIMTMEGGEETLGMGTMELVQIGDTSYMVLPEMGCMAVPVSEDELDNPMAEAFSPKEVLDNLDKVKLEGEEVINDIRVLHYSYDETALPDDEREGIESFDGHLYVAKDGGYLVRMVTDIVGNSTFIEDLQSLTDTAVHIEFDLQDVNSVDEIVPPAACEGQTAAESPFPMLEDATEVFNMAGISSYTTAVSLAEAQEFYQNTMAEMGYTYSEDESFITDTSAFLTFNGEDGAVNINLGAVDGKVSITILYESGE